jgi:hypothetical protein
MLYSDYIYGVADSRARFEEVLRASEQARLVGFASSTKDPPKSLFARSAARYGNVQIKHNSSQRFRGRPALSGRPSL